jgi:hypothetical protein
MEESHVEGVATHDDPESCAAAREDDGEALTGARTGAVWSREIRYFGVPTPLSEAEGQCAPRAPARVLGRPRAVVDPMHVRNLLAREPGDLHVTR